jgi:hypothetical protein
LGHYLNGQYAEVGIWHAALTAAEIASLAKGMTCDKVRRRSSSSTPRSSAISSTPKAA